MSQLLTQVRTMPVSFTAARTGFLQCKCACGTQMMGEGRCAECQSKKQLGQPLQAKLRINEPGDVYEQEADRVADQVLAASTHPAVSVAALRIQPYAGHVTGHLGTASTSVDRVLAGSGRPLEPPLRQDMERRFGHDFSQVRVHSGTTAEQSAHDVNAHAYTVGHDIVFAAGRFVPWTHDGRRLIAHELAHVVQQSDMSHGAQQQGRGASSVQRKEGDDKDEPKDKPKDAPKDTPKDALKNAPTAAGSCGGKSLASSITASDKRLNGSAVEASLGANEFGNTSKLGADFKFTACKVGTNWRFQLGALVVPIVSKVQAATFRKNIDNASAAEVAKESFADIVRDLSPTMSATFSVSCGNKKDKDKVKTYSIRKTYWNQQFVIDHEAFHRKDWVDMYRKELIKAENDVWAHSIPENVAKDAAGALARADPDLTKYMTDAYQRLCDAFTPGKESRAYDAGAPAYQKLVDEINARAREVVRLNP
jgi:hypothetical protein